MKILLLILTFFCSPAIAKQICISPIKDNDKSEIENLEHYLSSFVPTQKHGIFITNTKELQGRAHYTKNDDLREKWLRCIHKEFNSFQIEISDEYLLLQARLEYFSQAAEGKLSKIEFLNNEDVHFCFYNDASFDNLKEPGVSDECIDKKIEKINNHNHPNEFNKQWFERVERLAKKGYLQAQYNMMEIKRYGVGTKIDIIEAYAWGLVASTVNPPFGKGFVDNIYLHLSLKQQRQAELLSIEYLKNYSNIYDQPTIVILQ